jgi:glucose/arabinose dehydrogenase
VSLDLDLLVAGVSRGLVDPELLGSSAARHCGSGDNCKSWLLAAKLVHKATIQTAASWHGARIDLFGRDLKASPPHGGQSPGNVTASRRPIVRELDTRSVLARIAWLDKENGAGGAFDGTLSEPSRQRRLDLGASFYPDCLLALMRPSFDLHYGAAVLPSATRIPNPRWTRRAVAAVATVVAAIASVGCGGSGGHSSAPPAGVAFHQTGEPRLQAKGPPVVVASVRGPGNLAVDSRGGIWVTSSQSSFAGLWYVPSAGKVDQVPGPVGATAVVWIGDRLYVAAEPQAGEGQISVLEDFTKGGFARRSVLLDGLAAGSHGIGMIAGPGGRLFVGLGSLEDSSGPPGQILSVSLSGGTPVLEATGLRTDLGLAFWGSQLLVTDNGPDNVGFSPDVVQSFVPTGQVVDFGFPTCYNQGGPSCAGYPKPFVTFPPHSTPEGIAVDGDVAYVANLGSSVAQFPAASAIDSIDLRTGQVRVFWQSPTPDNVLGLALGPDGNLYATELSTDKIVRFDLH